MTETEENLSISRTVALGLSFCGSNLVPLALLNLQYGLVVYLSTVVLVPALLFEQMMVGVGVYTLIGVFSWCPVAIAIHRGILVDEPIKPLKYFPAFANRRTLRFFGYSVLFTVIFMGAFLLPIFFLELFEFQAFVPFAQLIAFVVVVGFLVGVLLTFPGIALDEYQSLRRARELLEGSVWRLFWATVLVAAPISTIQVTIVRKSELVIARVTDVILSMIFATLMVAVISYTYQFAKRRDKARNVLVALDP